MALSHKRSSFGALLILVCTTLGANGQADADILPLPAIMDIVSQRYVGEVVAAEVKPDDDDDDFYYELRLLTPAGNVLRIRIDAEDGNFLEVDGRGLVAAQRPLEPASGAE